MASSQMVIDWQETSNRLTIFFNEHNDGAMAARAPAMVQKMQRSARGELMGLVAMLKQKYSGDTFLFPMFDLNSVRDQLHQAFTEKAPSNLSQLHKMVVAVGKGALPLDQLQTMMYQKLQVMIEVEHSFIDITSAKKTTPTSAAKAAPLVPEKKDDNIISDTTDANGVRTVVRSLSGGGTSTSTSGGNKEYQKKKYEENMKRNREDAAREAATAKRKAASLAARDARTVVDEHTWTSRGVEQTTTITRSMPCGLCKLLLL